MRFFLCYSVVPYLWYHINQLWQLVWFHSFNMFCCFFTLFAICHLPFAMHYVYNIKLLFIVSTIEQKATIPQFIQVLNVYRKFSSIALKHGIGVGGHCCWHITFFLLLLLFIRILLIFSCCAIFCCLFFMTIYLFV